MRILFVVNDVETEVDRAATTVLATAACRRGHEVFMLGVREFEYYEDGHVGGTARRGPGAEVESQRQFLDTVQGRDAEVEDLRAGDLDVIWLRYNPAEEVGERAWAQHAGILFGQVALEHGVVVLNHPYSLSWAINKMYFQQFPEAVRPACIITRSYDRIRAFHEGHGRRIVLKPLMGYGGADVFLVGEDADNLRQIVESVGRSSYVIAQEFLPAASDGDTRLFLVNGKPLVVDGKYAAVRRVAGGGDFRSNMTAGGKPERARVDDAMLRLASLVGPKLVKDGIFFAGLDIVGDKLVEINTISAGGLNVAGRLEDADFGSAVIERVERKVFYKRHYGEHIRNIELATLE
jgi:glutathione synthase